MFRVSAIPIYRDNYVWLIHAQAGIWIVDPGDASPVIRYFQEHDSQPAGILITHKHWDHITGVAEMKEAFPVPAWGPQDRAIPLVDHAVGPGETIFLGDEKCEVLATPGHTPEHLSYHLPGKHALFCGDTLFSAGCGRVFDGSNESLFHSLRRIASLSATTRVYCTHEYTLRNIEFALTVEPHNHELQLYQRWCEQRMKAALPTLPTTIGWENRINPFLRTNLPQVRERAARISGTGVLDELEAFTILRESKNRY